MHCEVDGIEPWTQWMCLYLVFTHKVPLHVHQLQKHNSHTFYKHAAHIGDSRHFHLIYTLNVVNMCLYLVFTHKVPLHRLQKHNSRTLQTRCSHRWLSLLPLGIYNECVCLYLMFTHKVPLHAHRLQKHNLHSTNTPASKAYRTHMGPI